MRNNNSKLYSDKLQISKWFHCESNSLEVYAACCLVIYGLVW